MQSFEQLERKLVPFCGRTHVVVCSSGTAALHLALEALHLKPGSPVAVPSFTMVAVARAVTLAGLVPVFMDSASVTDPNIDPDRVHEFVCDNDCEALIAVHTYGRPLDMNRIHHFAKGYDLPVIEDLAEAHGLHPHPDTRYGCWSFYRNKLVNGEEGGAIACQDVYQANYLRALRSLGMGTNVADPYRHLPRGHNYRLSNANAEVIGRSLYLEKINRKIMNDRIDLLNKVCPADWCLDHRPYPWVYDLLLPDGTTRTKVLGLVSVINEMGLPARPGFFPLDEQEEYCKMNRSLMPNSNSWQLANRLLYLTVHPALVGEQFPALAERVFELLRKEV